MIQDYILDITRVELICSEFQTFVEKNIFVNMIGGRADYTSVGHWPYFPPFRAYITRLSRLVEICDLFGVKLLESFKQDLQRKIYMLEEEREETRNLKQLTSLIQAIAKPFSDSRYELYPRLQRLQVKEKERLNETIHVYLEDAYYSSVAMSVSAIEHRLLSIMKKANPQEASKLDNMTFGALINEYLNNKNNKYNNTIPNRHEPLLELCNKYRIFSVHPKEEQIDKRVASSVLNLTLEFLLDEKTTIIEK